MNINSEAHTSDDMSYVLVLMAQLFNHTFLIWFRFNCNRNKKEREIRKQTKQNNAEESIWEIIT